MSSSTENLPSGSTTAPKTDAHSGRNSRDSEAVLRQKNSALAWLYGTLLLENEEEWKKFVEKNPGQNLSTAIVYLFSTMAGDELIGSLYEKLDELEQPRATSTKPVANSFRKEDEFVFVDHVANLPAPVQRRTNDRAMRVIFFSSFFIVL